jgi:hypothetical protein
MGGFRRIGQLAVALALVAGGGATAALVMLGAPHHEPDPMDSPFLLPAFLALVPLAAAAGWLFPEGGRWWGLIAAGPPHYVLFAGFVVWGRRPRSESVSRPPLGSAFSWS